MRINARVLFARKEVDSALLNRLLAVFPEQEFDRLFLSEAALEDPRTQELLRLLESAGLRPWDFTSGRALVVGSEYGLTYSREYDASDLKECEYLQIWPMGKAVHIEADSRTSSGHVILPKRKMPRGFDIMITHLNVAYFTTERAKSALESAELRHVVFQPACFGPYRLQAGETEETVAALFGRPYWEIDTDLTLPPFAPSLSLKDGDGNPWERGDFSNDLQICEGLFQPPELRYRRSDLEELGTFDLARTLEPIGIFSSYNRKHCPLIASRRFYQVCVKNRLKVNWVPVRIDSE